MINRKNIEDRIEKIKGCLSTQAKKAELCLNDIKSKIVQIDMTSTEARERLSQLRQTGLGEIHRLKTVLEGEVGRLSKEVHISSEKLKAEFKAMTEAERTKRRGRGRSSGT